MKLKTLIFALLVGTVYAANWSLQRWGIVPVGFGMEAPAGVFFAGLAFALRDMLHEAGGKRWVLAAVATGAGLSWWVSDAVAIPGGHASIAVASGVAFLFAELADFAVYAPLRERRWVVASMSSNVVGAVVDSVLFLWLAFGAIDHLDGQVFAKIVVTVPALAGLWWVRR